MDDETPGRPVASDEGAKPKQENGETADNVVLHPSARHTPYGVAFRALNACKELQVLSMVCIMRVQDRETGMIGSVPMLSQCTVDDISSFSAIISVMAHQYLSVSARPMPSPETPHDPA